MSEDEQFEWTLCNGSAFTDNRLRKEIALIGEEPRLHRKQWEYGTILRGARKLWSERAEVTALGLGIGTDPICDALASMGTSVLASGCDTFNLQETPFSTVLERRSRTAARLRGLNLRGITERIVFDTMVRFRYLNLKAWDRENNENERFDFIWSCSLLHRLGSLATLEMVLDQSYRRLAPGGIALHTCDVVLNGGRDISKPHLFIPSRERLSSLHRKFGDGTQISPLITKGWLDRADILTGGDDRGRLLRFILRRDPLSQHDEHTPDGLPHHLAVRAYGRVLGSAVIIQKRK